MEKDEEAKNVDVEGSDAISATASDFTMETASDGVTSEKITIRSYESVPAVHSYQIKPVLADKFKAAPVKEIIRNTLFEGLRGRTYDPENVKKWTVELANEISTKVTDLKMKRYKHVVQVILGENKGAGVKSGVRCLWDSDTDGYTSDLFTNDSMFCLAVVYAVYLY